MNQSSWRIIFGTLLCALLAPTPSAACGLPLNAHIPAEQALITFANGQERIITSVVLEEAEQNAAVLFPVPAQATVEVIENKTLFDHLAAATQPEIRTEEQLVWRMPRSDTAGGAPGATLLSRETIGEYDVAQLSGSSAADVQSWLDTNNFTIPAKANDVLQSYLDDGWLFVAVKLASNPSDGNLAPLSLTFASPRLVYPMRLGALSPQPLHIELYVVADQRVTMGDLETIFAGSASDVAAQAPQTAPYLQGAVLTRLSNTRLDPGSISGDFVAQPSVEPVPFRKVVTRTVEVVVWDQMQRPILVLVLIVVLNVLVVAITYLLRRHMLRATGADDDR